jgi:hypothetical protein
MLGTSSLLEIIHQGWMTNYPLAIGSILVITIFFERMWRFRGLAEGTRELTRSTIEALVQRDVDRAKTLCNESNQPIAKIYVEAMHWQNVPLEDLERVLSTSRQEAAYAWRSTGPAASRSWRRASPRPSSRRRRASRWPSWRS